MAISGRTSVTMKAPRRQVRGRAHVIPLQGAANEPSNPVEFRTMGKPCRFPREWTLQLADRDASTPRRAPSEKTPHPARGRRPSLAAACQSAPSAAACRGDRDSSRVPSTRFHSAAARCGNASWDWRGGKSFSPSVRMSPPTVFDFAVVVLFEGLHGVFHGSIRRRPFGNVGKVHGGVAVFGLVEKLDWTPE